MIDFKDLNFMDDKLAAKVHMLAKFMHNNFGMHCRAKANTYSKCKQTLDE